MTETLEHGYSSESTQREISKEYQHDIVLVKCFQNPLCPCALDESSLSIGRFNAHSGQKQSDNFGEIFKENVTYSPKLIPS